MKILDFNKDYVGVLYVLLLQSSRYSYLPELRELVGDNLMVEILDRFAGTTIKFPSENEISIICKNLSIYIRLRKVPLMGREAVIQDLASEYFMEPHAVDMAFTRMRDYLENELGFSFVSEKRKYERKK